MRTASVLLVTLRGLSTEVAKNIVLAGVGRLTLLDQVDVSPEDLGSGFFFRDEDVGKKVKRLAD
jgi:ubiquitin-like 1-activating enzyme E1 A